MRKSKTLGKEKNRPGTAATRGVDTSSGHSLVASGNYAGNMQRDCLFCSWKYQEEQTVPSSSTSLSSNTGTLNSTKEHLFTQKR